MLLTASVVGNGRRPPGLDKGVERWRGPPALRSSRPLLQPPGKGKQLGSSPNGTRRFLFVGWFGRSAGRGETVILTAELTAGGFDSARLRIGIVRADPQWFCMQAAADDGGRALQIAQCGPPTVGPCP